ncbi:SLAP domain-containing protein [Lactobacillus sp. ESL0731]|uniref:SLAP domain-containing protein n=1 Tax=unclassified Lactobacillus TaxID=2620435 RepID=UPI0023F6C2F4|nr:MULTISPECIES: SLAP domain-containing protein [unclassified Lactobacillus]WEV51230.1 SLAP domain-containing protein [Lactobacillus sp. ESL0700]WEV62360.1 SLAP domain-containing protein [Lactobacillus sp. ESL0731]
MKKRNYHFSAKIIAGLALIIIGYQSTQQITAADELSIADEISAANPVAQKPGQEVTIPTNTNLTGDTTYAKLSIANWQSMPNGTELSWSRKPSTLYNGLSQGTITVTLPDGTTKSVSVTVNIAGTKQVKLHRDSYLYDKKGRQINDLQLKKGSIANVLQTKKINGHNYYELDDNHFLPVTPLKKVTKQIKITKSYKRVMHSTYLYDEKGHRTNGLILKAGSRVKIHKIAEDNNIHIAAGRFFYLIGKKLYVPVRNVTGLETEWQDKAIPVYNYHGKRVGQIKAHTPYHTYGDSIQVRGKSYYIVGKGKLIKNSIQR